MAQRLNYYSFIASFVCWGLFLFVCFTGVFNSIKTSLNIILTLTIISFFICFIGLSWMKDWKSCIRSMTALFLTLGLLAVLIFIIGTGKLLG
ncbi:hypothetical protein SAMN05443252_108125 [Bacillus sp. OV322]|nr:hypothetical protein SAMN05443252_108125 [Bacillus sp. OV322]